MEATTILAGLAGGALVTITALVLWEGLRRLPGRVGGAVQVMSGLAGVFLLLGVLLAWLETRTLLTLLLIAAMAAPQSCRRSSWSHVLPLLPPLVLVGIGLFWRPAAGGGRVFIALAAALCAGLGTRALGEALRALAGQIPAAWPGLAAPLRASSEPMPASPSAARPKAVTASAPRAAGRT